jgi:hypothetical protein
LKQMRLDTTQLPAAAREIAGAAQTVRQEVSTLRATVTDGNPWGGDEPGSLFGAVYVGVLDHAMRAVGSHADLLASAAEGLTTWASRAEAADADAAAGFDALAARLGG